MELDPIRCNARLAVKVIKEADATHANRHAGRFEAPRRGELRVELAARALNRCQEATAAGAGRVRYLGDHRASAAVPDDKVVVAIRLQLVLDQCRVDRIDRRLLGLNAIVGGKRAGRWIAPHRGDRGRCDRSDIDEAGVGVGACLHGPSLDTAGAFDAAMFGLSWSCSSSTSRAEGAGWNRSPTSTMPSTSATRHATTSLGREVKLPRFR